VGRGSSSAPRASHLGVWPVEHLPDAPRLQSQLHLAGGALPAEHLPSDTAVTSAVVGAGGVKIAEAVVECN
jgi:hypothetical protein